MIPTKENKKLIDDYFNHPMTRQLLNEQLGPRGVINIDWENEVVTAKGSKSGMEWDLIEMIRKLKNEPH